MKLLPENYNDLNLDKEEKIFVNLIKNKFDNNVYMLINTYPLSKIKCNALIFNEGICFVEIINLDSSDIFRLIINSQLALYESNINKVIAKFNNYNIFNDLNGNLKIQIRYKFYLPKLTRNDIDIEQYDSRIKEFIEKQCVFKEDILKLGDKKELLRGIFIEELNRNQLPIKDDLIDSSIHVIAPEYTIPIFCENSIEKKMPDIRDASEYIIKENSKEIKVLKLDNDQINIINNIKPGHQLILACAGSGKSVLLIAKCFKIASIHDDKEFLITCFNTNLSQMYNWRKNIAGFRERNVACMTFHKLCMTLLDEINISYKVNDYDEIFKLAKKYLMNGKITKRYFGIFIDEVQVFKPEWYEFCYRLLESKNEGEYFFVICGDKSQNISNNIKQGKAPWQGNKSLPNYRGRSLRLEKNYRNTKEINNYINNFTEIAKKYSEKLNIELREDTDSILRGKAVRNGDLPIIISANKKNEKNKILDSIKFLNEEKKIPLTEIAVLFCNRKYSPDHYYIYYWVTSILNENGIEYSEISPEKSENRVSYEDRVGVTLSTVESSLGLDFKAVIICGIRALGMKKKTKTVNDLINLDDEQKIDFIKNINTLYTGCTRAREELIVILSDKNNKSIYSDILFNAQV